MNATDNGKGADDDRSALEAERGTIDALDEQMIALFNERLAAATRIGEI